jgi:hypothetical protein
MRDSRRPGRRRSGVIIHFRDAPASPPVAAGSAASWVAALGALNASPSRNQSPAPNRDRPRPATSPHGSALRRFRDRLGSAAQDPAGHRQRARLLRARRAPSSIVARQPPASWTGQLAGSISTRVFRGGDGVLIRDTAYYARFLETGAKGGIGSGRKGAKGRRNARQRRGGVATPAERLALALGKMGYLFSNL